MKACEPLPDMRIWARSVCAPGYAKPPSNVPQHTAATGNGKARVAGLPRASSTGRPYLDADLAALELKCEAAGGLAQLAGQFVAVGGVAGLDLGVGWGGGYIHARGEVGEGVARCLHVC